MSRCLFTALFLTTTASLLACTGLADSAPSPDQTAPAANTDRQPKVVVVNGDRTWAVITAAPIDGEPGESELVYRDGEGAYEAYATFTARPASIVDSPDGVPAIALSIDGYLDGIAIGNELVLGAPLPDMLGEMVWQSVDGKHVLIVSGPNPDGAGETVRFAHGDEGWGVLQPSTGAVTVCKKTTADPVTWGGSKVSELLAADLDGDGLNERVVELADSCGTGGCDGLVLRPCSSGASLVGRLTTWGEVSVLKTSTAGWRDLAALQSGRIATTQTYRWTGTQYEREQ